MTQNTSKFTYISSLVKYKKKLWLFRTDGIVNEINLITFGN